jgi:hypothetical protein
MTGTADGCSRPTGDGQSGHRYSVRRHEAQQQAGHFRAWAVESIAAGTAPTLRAATIYHKQIDKTISNPSSRLSRFLFSWNEHIGVAGIRAWHSTDKWEICSDGHRGTSALCRRYNSGETARRDPESGSDPAIRHQGGAMCRPSSLLRRIDSVGLVNALPLRYV